MLTRSRDERQDSRRVSIFSGWKVRQVGTVRGSGRVLATSPLARYRGRVVTYPTPTMTFARGLMRKSLLLHLNLTSNFHLFDTGPLIPYKLSSLIRIG